MVKLTFRPWSEFLELNSFKIPASADYADRVQVNCTYYQANYLGLVLLHCIVACFFRPLFLLGLSISVASAIYLFSVRKTPLTLSGAKVLSKKEVMILYAVGSLLLCLIFGGSAAILALAIATLVILIHSSLRQRSLKSKVNVGLINMLGGGSGKLEDGADDSLPFESDPENPQGGSGRGASEADLAKLGGAGNDALLAEQQKFRSAFRASMRNKYLKKG